MTRHPEYQTKNKQHAFYALYCSLLCVAAGFMTRGLCVAVLGDYFNGFSLLLRHNRLMLVTPKIVWDRQLKILFIINSELAYKPNNLAKNVFSGSDSVL